MENHRWRAALTFGLTLFALSVIFTWFSWAQLADGAFLSCFYGRTFSLIPWQIYIH